MTYEEFLSTVKEDDYTVDLEEEHVTLHYAGEGSILATSELGEISDDAFQKLCSAMITANHMFQGTAGATLSMEPGTHRAYLQRLFWMQVESAEAFLGHLTFFLQKAAEWKKRLAGFSVEEEQPPQAPLLDNNFFIRV